MTIRMGDRRDLWITNKIGPLARAALDAIGRTDIEGEIKIEFDGVRVFLNGTHTDLGDVGLVRRAWESDPRDFGPEAPSRDVVSLKRSIVIRRLLAGTAA